MAEGVNGSTRKFVRVKCWHVGECKKLEEYLPKRDKFVYAMIVCKCKA